MTGKMQMTHPTQPVEPILSVDGLSVSYGSARQPLNVVKDVSFDVAPGQVLGIVGESGSGKSQTVLAVLQLLAEGGRISGGQVRFEGAELQSLSQRRMRKVRGQGIALISQDALSSLNPSMKIGRQMAEPLIAYDGLSASAARKRCTELLDLVGIPAPAHRLESYPHELSGGMRQRVLIAMAISRNPRVLIADEPTTALDVTIQAQIINLIDDLRKELGMALVLITHDLGVVAGIADRISVMYAGRMVETATTDQIFAASRHPYTRALLNSIPKPDQPKGERLKPIPGLPVDPREDVRGCAFNPRCTHALASCTESLPAMIAAEDDGQHQFRCPVDPFRPAEAEGPRARLRGNGGMS